MQKIKPRKKKQKINQVFFNNVLLFLFLLLLPTQFGKHFFFSYSYLSGIRVDYLAPTIYLTDILIVLLLIVNFQIILQSLLNKKILLILGLLMVNVLLSQNQLISLYRFVKILEFLIVFYIFHKNTNSWWLALFGFLSGSVFELFLSTAQFVSKHSIQGIFYFFGERYFTLSTPGIAKASLNGVEIIRPYGTFSHPNSLSGFYLLLYFFVLTDKRFNKHFILKNLFLLTSSLLIFFSFSKIIIFIYLVLNIFYIFKNSLKNSCRVCIVAKILALLVLSFLFLQARGDPLTIQKRLALMSDSLLIIIRHPIFGVGLGNYLSVANQYPIKFPDFFNQPVHNIFLLLISELGIPLTTILTFMSLSKLKKIWKNNLYLFLIILLTGLFDHYWLTLQQNFLVLGVILAVL